MPKTSRRHPATAPLLGELMEAGLDLLEALEDGVIGPQEGLALVEDAIAILRHQACRRSPKQLLKRASHLEKVGSSKIERARELRQMAEIRAKGD